jgi:GH35 family endo-1,4-beta-xylanase
MTDKRRILDLFDEQRDLVEERVSAGIEANRKGNGRIRVLDQKGAPVANASIKLTQKTHEFRFGANLFMLDEMESEEKNEAYKRYFSDLFNMATLPFYWDALEPERGKPRYAKDSPKIYRRPSPDLCIEFCEKHGIEPREHALAYEHFFPAWLSGACTEEVKRELERRYAEISERYAHKIPTIEVTNEMEWTSGRTAFYDEPDFVEWCFKLAERYFPNNQLCINEHTSSAWMDKCRATDKYYSYIEANLLKGARIDAIGMQYHLFNQAELAYEKTRLTLNPQSLYRHMALYSNFGKPLQITEVTVPA